MLTTKTWMPKDAQFVPVGFSLPPQYVRIANHEQWRTCSRRTCPLYCVRFPSRWNYTLRTCSWRRRIWIRAECAGPAGLYYRLVYATSTPTWHHSSCRIVCRNAPPIERKPKDCLICDRNCNDADHAQPKTKKLRWCYENQARICPLTNLEIVQGKECHYCYKVYLSQCCACSTRLLLCIVFLLRRIRSYTHNLAPRHVRPTRSTST